MKIKKVCDDADAHGAWRSRSPGLLSRLHHAAPMTFTMSCLQSGIKVIVMEHFDPELALESDPES